MRLPLHLSVSVLALAAPIVIVRAFSPTAAGGRDRCSSSTGHQADSALSYANEPSVPMTLPFNPLMAADQRSSVAVDHNNDEQKQWSKRDLAWNRRYQELVAYYNQYGNADVPLNWPDNNSLATWVTNQRRKRRNNDKDTNTSGLKPYQIAALDAISFCWNPHTPWKQRFAQLHRYKQQHGNCMVPSNDANHRELYVWCCNQRQQYRHLCENLSSTLTPDRLEALASIGFFENNGNMQTAAWQMRLLELNKYKAVHGDCNVPRHYAANPKLGRWCDTQRRSKKLGTLKQDRIDTLNAMDFDWSPAETMHLMKVDKAAKSIFAIKKKKKKKTPWMKRYKELKRFKQRHGHVAVNQSTRLGNWVKAQRWQYKLMQKGEQSSMTATRFALLNDLSVFGYQGVPDGIKVLPLTHSNSAGEGGSTSSSTVSEFVAAAPFVRVGMSDEELFAAWHERFAEFRK